MPYIGAHVVQTRRQKGWVLMKSILDRSFRYTSSAQTDVRKTFARVRREQQLQEQARARADAETVSNISPLRMARTATAIGSATAAKL